jgi:acetyl esterase/lipase
MASPQLQAIIQMFRAQPVRAGMSIQETRGAFEGMTSMVPVAPDITREPVNADAVPAEWISAPNATGTAALYWLHGGGYTIGSINTHRDMISRISRASGLRAFAIDYRLAPEHPFPAALEDALTGYRWLLKQGADPKSLVIGGDSAGGGLALATLVSLRDAGDPLPAAAVLYSPWTDLAFTGESVKTRADADPWIKPDIGGDVPSMYHGNRSPTDPLVSPLYADLTGLPPTLIIVGDAEVLLDDSTRVAAKAKAAGVDVTLEVWDEMIHVFPGFAAILPEGQQAIDRTGEFIRQKVHTGATV